MNPMMHKSLSYGEAQILLFLRTQSGIPSSGKIARGVFGEAARLGVSHHQRGTTLRYLARLEMRGLIERAPDGRWLGGNLTALGRFQAVIEETMPQRRIRRKRPAHIHAKAIAGQRTVYPSTVRAVARPTLGEVQTESVLKPGSHNSKLGLRVEKGRFTGYHIYSLSLEERKTCPRYCERWVNCYGNNMPRAHRFAHGQPLEDRIEVELQQLLSNPRLPGVLLRLHALGDFYSRGYVDFWRRLLMKESMARLAIFGYTALSRDSEIGRRVFSVSCEQGPRFMIRWSSSDDNEHMGATWYEDKPPSWAFACPEQTNKVATCAKCGACWNGSKTVAFKMH